MVSQRDRDRELQTYEVSFPSKLDGDVLVEWLGVIATAWHVPKWRWQGVPTLVFEVLVTDTGIRYRLKMNRRDYEFIVPQLTTLIAGSSVEPVEDSPVDWDVAAEFGETNKHLPLHISSTEAVSASIIRSMQTHRANHAALLQLIISPMGPVAMPPKDRRTPSYTRTQRVLYGITEADHDEVDARRKKLSEKNVLAAVRVATKAPTPELAGMMLTNVSRALHSVSRHPNRFTKIRQSTKVVQAVKDARAPMNFPAQLAISELTALLGWPVGSPNLAGLPVGKTRQLVASGGVAHKGIVLGRSTFSGNQRPIALTVPGMTMHTYVCGPTGSGKTAADANIFYQWVSQGLGAAIIETKGEANDFYHKALNYVPRDRLQDVIVVDVTDTEHPVGFNILQQGNPQTIAASIENLFEEIYGHTGGVRMPAALYHALMVLMTSTHAPAPLTFADLPLLYAPMGKAEYDFVDHLIRGVPDPEIRRWWQMIDNQYSSLEKRNAFFEPLNQRAWQLNGRPEVRNIIGQSRSSFNMAQAIRDRKILLFNFAGLGKQVRSLLGSIIIDAIWGAIKGGAGDPRAPFLLGLDEFQNYPTLGVDFPELAREARAFGLSMLLSNQTPYDLSQNVMGSVLSNVRNTVVYQSDYRMASAFANEFGKLVSPDDFLRLGQYEAICRVMGDSGRSEPFTMLMQPPLPQPGLGNAVIAASRTAYSRPRAQVEQEIQIRRTVVDKRKKPKIGESDWEG